ncbi:hypothetical protein SETIT_3G030900v2 [Setaria italica]|uniref:Uncharacterized protein n=1 Tax=Setaria italica TaxID=4555 RepID=A0A368QB91_SETIT|nr:hypothetical protein SETIT_3G030900v2 [Setaria italica]
MAWGLPPRPPLSKVQALYELCKRTFPSPSVAGASPSSPPADAVRRVPSLMGTSGIRNPRWLSAQLMQRPE